MPLVLGRLNHLAELVGADKFFGAVSLACIFNGENERATVSSTSAAGVPVFVGDGTEAVVFSSQIFQSGINSLLFRADQTDLDFAFLQSKHLRPQHGSVGNADKLEVVLIRIVARNDKEPGAVRRSMNMCCLDIAVNMLFFRR